MPENYLPFSYGKEGFRPTYPKKGPKTKLKPSPKGSPRALSSGGSFTGAGGTKQNTQRKVPLSTTSFSNYQGAYNTAPRKLPGVNSFTNYQGAYNIGPSLAKNGLPAPSTPPNSATEQAALAALGGTDFAGLLDKLLKPQGPDYSSMIAALANPKKIADIDTPNLHYIFERYNPMIKSAWQGLGAEVEGLRSQAVGREAASQEALKQGFAQTAADVKGRFDKSSSDLQSFAERLGVADALKSEGGIERQNQGDRLAGIAQILGQNDLATAQNLATARQSNYDTILSMGRGAEARGLADLASLVAAGQSQADLNTQGYYRDAKLAEAQGRSDLAQIYAGHMGTQQQNQMDMIKLWSQLKSDAAAAEAAKQQDNPLTETTEDVYQDQPFWDSINALAAGDPDATALLDKVSGLAGSSLPEMQKLLAGFSAEPVAKYHLNPFKWSSLSKKTVSSRQKAEQAAAKKLLLAYKNYGGWAGKPKSTTTIKYNSAKEPT